MGTDFANCQLTVNNSRECLQSGTSRVGVLLSTEATGPVKQEIYDLNPVGYDGAVERVQLLVDDGSWGVVPLPSVIAYMLKAAWW
jgi:hypothetical protein